MQDNRLVYEDKDATEYPNVFRLWLEMIAEASYYANTSVCSDWYSYAKFRDWILESVKKYEADEDDVNNTGVKIFLAKPLYITNKTIDKSATEYNPDTSVVLTAQSRHLLYTIPWMMVKEPNKMSIRVYKTNGDVTDFIGTREECVEWYWDCLRLYISHYLEAGNPFWEVVDAYALKIIEERKENGLRGYKF